MDIKPQSKQDYKYYFFLVEVYQQLLYLQSNFPIPSQIFSYFNLELLA